MYVNERDQINYHGFLRALREMNQVSQESVSKGICTTSGMNRFENGNRIAEKLMRDRLTARLGISGEKYEDYLQPKEYARWEQRLRIVKAIEKKDLKTAKKELASYEALPGLNCLNAQFVETMRFMILSSEGASDEVLLDCVKKALKNTIPNVTKALAGGHLLADQEINLIAEYMRLCPPKKVVRDLNAWRISEYEKLITYMDNSRWEKLQKAKVYPKIAYYICQLLLEKEPTEEACHHGLELCHNAIELLRDTSRLYYFIELTESRRALAERLMTYDIASSERTSLEKMLDENNAWEKVFKDLYAEYKVAPYMSDFCYLYYETECHNIVKVIEIRRNMLGLSRVKLGDGICNERTIIRFEREGKTPTMELVRLMFEKMGMCAEYRRARVVTNDVEALMLSNEVTENMNNYEFEKCSKNLSELKHILNMNILQNKQEISRLNMLLRYRNAEIGKREFYEWAKRNLEYTIPMKVLDKKGDKYFSRSEITCLADIAFETAEESSEKCLEIIKKEYAILYGKKEINVSQLCVCEFIANGLENYLGNIGEYNESNLVSRTILKECLLHRRVEVIADNLYNMLWNNLQSVDICMDMNYITEVLNQCLLISQLLNKVDRIAFFQEKLITK